MIDDLRKLVREREDHLISFDWIPGTFDDPEVTKRIQKSIQFSRSNLIRDVHNPGGLLSSIREFRTEIYVLRNYQMAVRGILIDNRGKTYSTRVYDF